MEHRCFLGIVGLLEDKQLKSIGSVSLSENKFQLFPSWACHGHLLTIWHTCLGDWDASDGFDIRCSKKHRHPYDLNCFKSLVLPKTKTSQNQTILNPDCLICRCVFCWRGKKRPQGVSISKKQVPTLFAFGMPWSHLLAMWHVFWGNWNTSNGFVTLRSKNHRRPHEFNCFRMFLILIKPQIFPLQKTIH